MSEASDDPGQLLTTGDIAKLAGVSPNAVFHWAHTGKLVPTQRTLGGVGLYRRDAVERFLSERAEAGK